MNPEDLLTKPYFDPNDAGGQAAATDANAGAPDAAVVPAQAAAPVNADPLGVADAQQKLAVAQLHGVLQNLQDENAALKQQFADHIANLSKSAQTAVVSGDEVPAEIAATPEYKLLKRIADQVGASDQRIAALESNYKQTLDRQTAFDKQTRVANVTASEQRKVTDWLDKVVIPADPELTANPVMAIALKMKAQDWLKNSFDPESDVATQENQLRIEMGQALSELKRAAGTAPSKRDAALETDTNNRNNLTAGAANKPNAPAGPDKNPHSPHKEPELFMKWQYDAAYRKLQGAVN